jgi:hypothetical protein
MCKGNMSVCVRTVYSSDGWRLAEKGLVEHVNDVRLRSSFGSVINQSRTFCWQHLSAFGFARGVAVLCISCHLLVNPVVGQGKELLVVLALRQHLIRSSCVPDLVV